MHYSLFYLDNPYITNTILLHAPKTLNTHLKIDHHLFGAIKLWQIQKTIHLILHTYIHTYIFPVYFVFSPTKQTCLLLVTRKCWSPNSQVVLEIRPFLLWCYYKYRIAPSFMVQKFCENVENHWSVDFRAKNFVIACGEPTTTAGCSKFLGEKFL